MWITKEQVGAKRKARSQASIRPSRDCEGRRPAFALRSVNRKPSSSMDSSLRPAPGADPEPLFSARPFSAPYASPDEEIASLLFAQAARPAAAEARIDRIAT